MQLLDLPALHASSVVANCAMNRERRLSGTNSYERELGLDVLRFLTRSVHHDAIAWVDLCCGTGRALIEAAARFRQSPIAARVHIEGVDLVGGFDENPCPAFLSLNEQDIESWTPRGLYRLATCVHGLHYIGDKLATLAKVARCLEPTGLLIANLDLANFRFPDGRPAGRTVASRLRRSGFTYDARRKVVRCQGRRIAEFGLRYLGADDTAGPNYTGQSAVDSYYADSRP